MRRAEAFRAQAGAYCTVDSERLQQVHGREDDAERVLALFAFTPEHLKLLGCGGIERLGEIVCHAWALHAGNEQALVRWFATPHSLLGGQTPGAMVRNGQLQVLLLVVKQQLEWELPKRTA